MSGESFRRYVNRGILVQRVFFGVLLLEEGSLECVGRGLGPAESRKGFLRIRRGAIEVHLPKGAVRKFDLSPSQEASKSLLTAPSSEGALGAGSR